MISVHLLEISPNDPSSQVMVPWMTVPFLSSIVTVSLLSFIKNLQQSARDIHVGATSPSTPENTVWRHLGSPLARPARFTCRLRLITPHAPSHTPTPRLILHQDP